MKYYQDQEIQEAWLEGLSERELQIIRAEIEALRGRDFSSEPWLWEHFQNRYWYRPAEYSRSMLNATERKNIEIITGYEKKRRGVAILPGEADRWQAKRLSEADLRGLSLHELRLLRNEFYARRGRTFLTAWLQSYFDAQPWYRAKSGFRDTSVTATDKANIETIVAYEGKLHDSLGTQAVSPSLLADMGQEDARRLRNEIYARHGKRFQDRRLQAYFQSFDWYRPNPGYRDTLLTPIERQNIAKILAHEKEAQVYVDRVEA